MSVLRFGTVGSGFIADVIAGAIKQVEGIELVAVASRRPERARAFAHEHTVPLVFDTWQELVASEEIDAVYVATPTSMREEICLAVANHGKHLLAEKPFTSYESLQRITSATRANDVAFMDATHFVHNPRTRQVRETQEEAIGGVQAVRSVFFFPFMERNNIRFNPDLEPTGAVGDMAWYCMRAVTEFLRPAANLAHVGGGIVRDRESGAVVRGAGILVFEDGKTSTFDFGYNAGVCLMELDILGTRGMLHMDDFVLDWKHGFAFDNQAHVPGYTKRSGMQEPGDFEFIAADSEESQQVLMIRNFATLAAEPSGEPAKASMDISGQTQYLLDQYWRSVSQTGISTVI